MPRYPYSPTGIGNQQQVKPNNQGGLKPGVDLVPPYNPPTILPHLLGPEVPLAPIQYWKPIDRPWIEYLRCRQQCVEDRRGEGESGEPGEPVVPEPAPLPPRRGETPSPSWVSCYSGNGPCSGLPKSPLRNFDPGPDLFTCCPACVEAACLEATGKPDCGVWSGNGDLATDTEISLYLYYQSKCWQAALEDWQENGMGQYYLPREGQDISCWLCLEDVLSKCCDACESIKPQTPPSERVAPILERSKCF